MKQAYIFLFPPFRFVPANAQVRNGAQEIPLRLQAFALLRYLLEHAPRLVTKKELFERACADAYGSERSLWVCIGELRKTLGDQAKAPRFIRTVHSRRMSPFFFFRWA